MKFFKLHGEFLKIFSTILPVFIYSACSSMPLKITSDMDLIAQVMKNYEPDFRYCISLTTTKDEYISDFLLLPSGMILSSKVTTKSASVNETTKCMETLFNKIIFPPVKDKTAKQIKRELVFTEIKS